ncbi:MAG: HmuY family protein [Bacteroidota bacterium]
MRHFIHILMLALLLPSCFQEEDMVPPHEQGDLELGEVALGTTYSRQVYFDLLSNDEIASNVISDWDLSFESASGGWIIRLNSSKFMLAGNSFNTDFAAELKSSDLHMRFDQSDGNPDSTALGPWFEITEDSVRSLKHVYLLDRGKNEQNKSVGYKKVQFDIRGQEFVMRCANTDNSQDTTVIITRDPSMDLVHFSFDTGLKEIAPLPDQWSLHFTKYTTMLQTNEGEDYPYLVTGVLLNPNGAVAAQDTLHDFMDISREIVPDLEFTTRADVIGYEWKYYNFDAGVYTIVPDMNFVIRDRDGYFYKLRFIDFNNDQGEKGYPKFEFVSL